MYLLTAKEQILTNKTGAIAFAAAIVTLIGTAAMADDVKVLPLPANRVLWDVQHKCLYALVAGGANAGQRANSLCILDPVSGSILSSQFVGSEPGNMALSSSGRYLYIGVGGSNAVRVYDTVKRQNGPLVSLGAGISSAGMCAAPGLPDSCAVQKQNRSYSPSDNGTVIIGPDGIIGKDASNSGHSLVYDALADRMYGFENEISSYGLKTMGSSATGVVDIGYLEGLIIGNTALVAAENGLLYTNTGSVIDPAAGQKTLQYPGFGYGSMLVPDASSGKLFGMKSDRRGPVIEAYDIETAALLGAVPVTGGPQPGGQIVRWGENGFAYPGNNGSLCIFRSDIVGKAGSPVKLTVEARGLPANLAVGGSAVCTIVVKNSGSIPASSLTITDAFSNCLDVVTVTNPVGGTTTVGQHGAVQAVLPQLAAGASVSFTVAVRMKPIPAGGDVPFSAAQAAFVRAKECNSNPEQAHSQQIARIGVGSSPAAPSSTMSGPDLTGSWIAISQKSEGAGADLQATIEGEFEVTNAGSEDAVPSRLRLFLAETSAFRPEFAQLLQEIGVPALKPGGSFRAKLKARLPKGSDAIGLYVIASVNATSTVNEANRKNNIVPSNPIP